MTYLTKVAIWIVSIDPRSFSSFSFISKRKKTIVDITDTIIVHSFASSPVKYKYLLIFLFSFIYTVLSDGTIKST